MSITIDKEFQSLIPPLAPAWIEENKLGTRTNWRARSGYCTYPLYEFDMERIEEERAKV